MIYFHFLMLLCAAALSSMGAYFSIFGLNTIFAGAVFEITLLAIILEVAKVLTAAWIHLNWQIISRFAKVYLTMAVLILMFITELGIYGYMTRAFIEHYNDVASRNTGEIALIDSKIANTLDLKSGVDTQLGQIDKGIGGLKGNQALRAVGKQRSDKAKLVKEQQAHVSELLKLEQEKIKLSQEQKKVEVELGPLKYVAQALPWMKLDNESVARFLILTIMLVFDPLAIMLVMASSKAIARMRDKPKPKEINIKSADGKYPDIDLDKFFKYNANNAVKALDLTKVKL